MALELSSASTRFNHLIEQVEEYCNLEDDSQVRWITRRKLTRPRQGTAIEFGSAPIRVGPHLKAAVFEPLGTVVLTSATLSVAGKIDFLADRLGLALLEKDRFRFRQHESPFDFKRQVMPIVPTDFPLPQSREYAPRMPEGIWQILQATGGRAFVLFTSYQLLRRTYRALEGRLDAAGLRPAAQGSMARSELLQRFREGAIKVLFATDSFWEGVDVRGRALECVIITRLPFRVPTEPIQEARLEDLQKAGSNPFTAFTVPQAVLKFKQGFGRLIRAKTDRGTVAILDRRILTKPYGKSFLRSLPPTDLRVAPLEEIVRNLGDFFAKKGSFEEPPPPGPSLHPAEEAPD
jgi:ATP-dependent DNA helicase DinG